MSLPARPIYAVPPAHLPSLPRALTMRSVKHSGHEELTLLELVLQLHGEFRRSLEPIRVTPLQAGVLLFLDRHANAKLTNAAASLRIGQPTLSVVVKALVRKRWVTRQYSVEDRRAVCLSLSRRGKALALNIEQRVRQVETTLTEQDRRAPVINSQGSRA